MNGLNSDFPLALWSLKLLVLCKAHLRKDGRIAPYVVWECIEDIFRSPNQESKSNGGRPRKFIGETISKDLEINALSIDIDKTLWCHYPCSQPHLASPILINGRHVVVEEKRSTNRGKVLKFLFQIYFAFTFQLLLLITNMFGVLSLVFDLESGFISNSRIRFPTGRVPGYRSEGARGRGGNYGNGRGYGRGGDFNGWGDYGYRNGNRGGFSSCGGDGGYQRNDTMGAHGGRNDHMGASGGRMNRAGGSAVH
ncbi:hypothetical protein Lal_00037854, partial [Lupinus albus]